MISNSQILTKFFLNVINDIQKDAAQKNQKVPISSFRFEVDEYRGLLFGADYFKYLIYGRGPGGFPPPPKMLEWVQDNPEIFARAKQVFKYLTERQLAFLVGRKIARMGTDIHTGKKQGIDFLGILEDNKEEFLKQIAINEVAKIQTSLRQIIQQNKVPA
jgi:hypothetical protein